jgi:hypothetical protein
MRKTDHISHPYKTPSKTRRTGLPSGKALDSNSRGFRFQSRLGHTLSRLRIFVMFLSPSRQIPG